MTLAQKWRSPEERWRESLPQIQAVLDLTQALTHAEALESVYEAALDGICSSLAVERASVLLFDPDGVMRFKAWRGLSPAYREAVEGHTPWTPETRDPAPVLVEDMEQDEELAPLRPALREEGIGSLAFFPLFANDRVLGKFMLYHREPHRFSDNEVGLAMTIANQISIAIERRRSAVLLAESDARYRNLIETANEGVLVIDPDARITLVNRRLESMFGYSPGELEGGCLFDLMDEEGAAQARKNLERRRQGVREQFDFRFRHKDGSSVWGIVNAAPMLDADGRYQGSLTLITDISARKAAEERNKALAESIPQMVLMSVPEGTLTYVNEVWCKYTGLTLEETRAGGWHIPIHPDDRPQAVEAWTRALEAGMPYQVEIRICRHDGTYRWHLGTAQPVTLPDGHIIGWISSATDIHEMKRTQDRERFLAEAASLLSSSLDFEQTLSNLADMLVPTFADLCSIDVADPHSVIRRLEVRAVDAEKIEALKAIKVRDWRVAPGSVESIGERIRSGHGILIPSIDEPWIDGVADTEEHANMGKSFHARSFLMIPLKTRNQVVGSLSMVLTRPDAAYDTADMTAAQELAHLAATAIENARLYEESRDIAERLQRAIDVKDEFLGLVSHEMRTPITTIYGNAQVLQRIWARLEDDERRAALGDIEHDAERLQRIIENMLVLARVEAGREVATEPVLLNRLVESVVADVRNRYPSRRILLTLPERMLTVVAQPTYVELVLRNLIGNAHKYSPPDTPVTITVGCEGDEARVYVEDSGPGVAADETQRIFEPFYRARKTAAAPGAGMGLAVCRRLIEAQGGGIWAHNRPEGGLSVCFRLKLEPEET